MPAGEMRLIEKKEQTKSMNQETGVAQSHSTIKQQTQILLAENASRLHPVILQRKKKAHKSPSEPLTAPSSLLYQSLSNLQATVTLEEPKLTMSSMNHHDPAILLPCPTRESPPMSPPPLVRTDDNISASSASSSTPERPEIRHSCAVCKQPVFCSYCSRRWKPDMEERPVLCNKFLVNKGFRELNAVPPNHMVCTTRCFFDYLSALHEGQKLTLRVLYL
jgi:hypothetical protein